MIKHCENCADKSIFIEFFGETPVLKVLDFFIDGEFDFSMTEIAEGAEIGYSTLKLILPQMIRSGFLVQTRAVGKAKLFRLNLENEIMKKFRKFYWDVTRIETDRYFEEELKIPNKKANSQNAQKICRQITVAQKRCSVNQKRIVPQKKNRAD